jgi:hypothetical protein
MSKINKICYTSSSEVRTLLRTVYVSFIGRRAGKSAASYMTSTTNREDGWEISFNTFCVGSKLRAVFL